jgi:xylulokinase
MKVLGLDIGTQGVRAIVVNEQGILIAEKSKPFSMLSSSENFAYKEQDPGDWLCASYDVISDCVRQLKGDKIDAAAIDGTSGTILALDSKKKPLSKGIMYNDSRSDSLVGTVNEAAKKLTKKLGYTFSSSFALPKILWVKENLSDLYEKTWKFVHQSDYIYGNLTGIFDLTDYSTALKTGYDLIEERWPDFLNTLGIDKEKLPFVNAPGKRVGRVTALAAEKTGLSQNTVFYTGATDGIASSLAAGLCLPGEWATVIGTTMVFKGITHKLVLDPFGRVYSHKHPDGWWLPGGASNVGGRCLNEMFGKDNLKEYDKSALNFLPSGDITYPLTITGERFPFIKHDAQGFYMGDQGNTRKKYAAVMEGVGYTERFSYDMLQNIGCEVGNIILTAGGASKSPVWTQIRANILQKQLCVSECTEAAAGSAMLAVSGVLGCKISEAVRSMVRFTAVVDPDKNLKDRYDELYWRFVEECKKRFQL